jgi:hypothetical protein
MDFIPFEARILGEAAPTRQRTGVWPWSLAAGDGWPIRQRTAVCEIPMYVTKAGVSYPCRTLAAIDPLGRHVCHHHCQLLWICWGCGAWLPEGTSGDCSLQCTQAPHATQRWLGQRLGARYTTPESEGA